METSDMLKQLNTIFARVLDREEIDLKETTTAADVEDWDSLTHIQLVVETEKFFKVKFKAEEIQKFQNVGDMCRALREKLGGS